jgi:hypothetical protein
MYSKIWIFFVVVVLIAHNTNAPSTIEEAYVQKLYEKVAIKALNDFSSTKMKNEANVKELLRFFLAKSATRANHDFVDIKNWMNFNYWMNTNIYI